jgi:alanine racemase
MEGQARALVDLGAVRDNVTALRRRAGGAGLMAVVKADGYGHGLVPAATAAQAGGADWLGVITVDEALALRAAGIGGPLMCLLSLPSGQHEAAIRADVDLAASSAGRVAEIAAAAARAGRTARVHLKADTGMSRGGATPAMWPGVVDAALAAQAAGQVELVGLWSHLACADIPGHPSIDGQLAAFGEAVAAAEAAGARPLVRHLANTPATLTLPRARFDMVRTGGGIYGLSTLPGGPPDWLRPAMTVTAPLAEVKRVPPGSGVSYGHRYVTGRQTTLGLVPLGYAEGVPRGADGRVEVQARGKRWRIAGTVCMDLFVIDFGDEPVAEGDEIILFGPGDRGEPTPQDWADALGTISYDVVTRFGGRVPRSYYGVALADDPGHDGAVTRGNTPEYRVSGATGPQRTR